MTLLRLSTIALLSISVTVGCGDDGGDDGNGVDAAVDASSGDASDTCPGQLLFTGDYVDWDSTTLDFMGVFDATVTEVGNPSNSVQTAPNGRAIMCLPASLTSAVDFTHAQYATVRYTASPEATAAGPFSIQGLTAARATTLFQEIGKSREAGRAQVLVGVYDYGADTHVTGAAISLGNNNEGGYIDDGTGKYTDGATVTNDRFVFFANVEVGGGTTTVQVTPPAGKSCTGVGEIQLVADQIAATNFACQDSQ